jgi:RalA-binding protein 1
VRGALVSRAKKAISEEGIFRLSGSNIVIKGLRDRFNNEGDIKLLDGQYYDVHAVASLLKLYLRELPASVLTRELHLDFLKVLGKCFFWMNLINQAMC